MTENISAPNTSKARLHYAWFIVGSGVLVMFSCLGLARFSFGMLLPAMSEALDLTYGQRGYIGTGYFIGYLLMVALAPALAKLLGFRASIVLGLGVIAATMALLGLAGTYPLALVCYTFTGVGSGAANISMMALVSRWFAPSLRGTATGLVIAGNGLGIIFSGFLVPHVGHASGPEGWRLSWMLLAGAVALSCVLAGLVLRNSPSDKGLEMTGSHGRRTPPPTTAKGFSRQDWSLLRRLGIIYFTFGVTYIIYGTFIVTTLIDEHGLSEATAGRFWAWVGFFSLFSGPVFGWISDTFSRKIGLAAALAVQTAAYLLAGFDLGVSALYLSIGLYGLAAWSIPTVMLATIADRLGTHRAAAGFSIITFFFAVGQVVGPTAAGELADLTGSFSISYKLSACLTLVGIAVTATLTRNTRT